MNEKKKLITRSGSPVVDNQNTMTAGPRGPLLLQKVGKKTDMFVRFSTVAGERGIL